MTPDPQVAVMINDLVCEGCGDCSRASNCLSVVPVETEFGRKRTVDLSTCNKDRSCLDGFCPSFVTVEGGRLRKPTPALAGGEAIPDPVPAIGGDQGSLVVRSAGRRVGKECGRTVKSRLLPVHKKNKTRHNKKK